MSVREWYGHRYQKARAVNQTSASFVAKAYTLTEPTGGGTSATNASIITLGEASKIRKTICEVMLFGVGNENQTLDMRLIGWVYDGTGWAEKTIAQLQGTLSAAVGVAGGKILDTERICDTITITYGVANVDVIVKSPANDTPAYALISIQDSIKIEPSFQTGSSATSCNALIRIY